MLIFSVNEEDDVIDYLRWRRSSARREGKSEVKISVFRDIPIGKHRTMGYQGVKIGVIHQGLFQH